MSLDLLAARRDRRAGLALAAALAFAPFALAPTAGAAQDAEKPAAAAEAPAEAEKPAAEAPAPKASDVVAVVNGYEVTLGELIMMRADLPAQYQSAPPKNLVDALLQRIAVETAFAKSAAETGLDKSEELRLRVAIDRRARLAEMHMRSVLEGASDDAAIEAIYKAQVADAPDIQEVRASHILVKVDEETDSDAAKAKAEEIKAEIEKGAAFADMAKEHGSDGTRAQGGDLGWFQKERMVPEFAEAAFAAEEGKVVGPVQTQFGWHLILVTGKRVQPKPTLEQMRPTIAEQLSQTRARTEVETARAGADIKPAEGAPAAEAILDDSLLRAK